MTTQANKTNVIQKDPPVHEISKQPFKAGNNGSTTKGPQANKSDVAEAGAQSVQYNEKNSSKQLRDKETVNQASHKQNHEEMVSGF